MDSWQQGSIPEVVLWDLDGALIDSRQGIFACIDHTVDQLGLAAPTDAQRQAFIGPPLATSFAAWGAPDPEKAADVFRDAYAEEGQYLVEVMPGMLDVLARLQHRNVTQVVATAKTQEFSRLMCERLGIAAFLLDGAEGVHGPPRGAHKMTKADIMRVAVDHVASRQPGRESFVMVGDRHHDMTGAVELGMPGIGVEWGFGEDGELSEAGASVVCATPANLQQVFAVDGGEREFDDPEFERLYGAFARRTPADVARFMDGFDGHWYVAAGWAIEAFTGVQRDHHDIDPCILRKDVKAFQQHCAGKYDLWSGSAGALKPLRVNDSEDDLLPGCGQLWVRASAMSPWEFDVLLNPGDESAWVCRRDESIVLPADKAWWEKDGVRYLAPEATLLMKAKQGRPQDEADFQAALPLLSGDQRAWLSSSLEILHPGHHWQGPLKSK